MTRTTDGRRGVAAIAVALALMIPHAARATEQGASESSTDEVDARFQQGLTLFEEGKHLPAAAVWEQLLADLGSDRGWKLNYNLGLAYWAAKRPTLAVERFEAFVRRVAAEAAALPEELEQRREDAAAKIGVIKAEHGAVVLPAAPGVTVRIDGGAARPVGYTAYVTPGVHEVTVIGAGGEQRTVAVEARAGRQQIVDTSDPKPAPVPVPVVPVPIPVTTPPPPREEPPSFPWIPVGIGAGLTAAGFILPAVMFQRAKGKFQDAEALGAGHSGYAEARDDYGSAKTAYAVSYALPAGLGAI
ncbi:MAG TPA: hypothetical protein ENK57_14070, partial [Polyangiaceae bacterium]|nr:hypothetical protein [Polyangiaceae bacterium]